MSEKFKKVVQMFNDGEWDETLQPHFETIENFLKQSGSHCWLCIVTSSINFGLNLLLYHLTLSAQ